MEPTALMSYAAEKEMTLNGPFILLVNGILRRLYLG